MSGASSAAEALKAAAQEAYRRVFEAGSHFASRHSDVRVAEELAMIRSRTVELIAATETLRHAAESAADRLRAALADVRDE